MPSPRIAVVPRRVDWVEAAVESGGGTLVEPAQADALVWMAAWSDEGLNEALEAAPSIRWVQLPLAGVEGFAGTGRFGDGRTWTCAKGVYADPVAEHALALALAGMRNVAASARATSWARPTGRLLHGRDVCIVGGGGITEALLRLLGPFGTQNVVVRRRSDALPGAHRTMTPDHLLDAIGMADLVVLALALTPETEGLIGAAELGAMRPEAWLVNVARGRHIRTDDLVDALSRDAIGGAALDVTDPEPLPDGHPLWSLPNCIITPHAANTPAMAVAPLSERIRQNVARFGRGEELIGLIDPVLGY
ncbi:MAG: D-isomer specific 2-hydroxyacid dehydrogenase family protein [Acidimicrobiales bacterium]